MYLLITIATALTTIITFAAPSPLDPLLLSHNVKPPNFNSTPDCRWPQWPLASFLPSPDGSQTASCCAGTSFVAFGTPNATKQPSISDCRHLAAAMLPSNETHRGIRQAGFFAATNIAVPSSKNGDSGRWILVAHSGTCGLFIQPGLNVTAPGHVTAETVWIGSDDVARLVQGGVNMQQVRSGSTPNDTAGLCVFNGTRAVDGAPEEPPTYWLSWKIDWVDPSTCGGSAADGDDSSVMPAPSVSTSSAIGKQTGPPQSPASGGAGRGENDVCVIPLHDATIAADSHPTNGEVAPASPVISFTRTTNTSMASFCQIGRTGESIVPTTLTAMDDMWVLRDDCEGMATMYNLSQPEGQAMAGWWEISGLARPSCHSQQPWPLRRTLVTKRGRCGLYAGSGDAAWRSTVWVGTYDAARIVRMALDYADGMTSTATGDGTVSAPRNMSGDNGNSGSSNMTLNMSASAYREAVSPENMVPLGVDGICTYPRSGEPGSGPIEYLLEWGVDWVYG